METPEESFCCSDRKFHSKVDEGMCATDHEEFKILTHKVALEANLISVWNAGEILCYSRLLKIVYCTGINDTATQEISNANLRYAAYRSLFGWLW